MCSFTPPLQVEGYNTINGRYVLAVGCPPTASPGFTNAPTMVPIAVPTGAPTPSPTRAPTVDLATQPPTISPTAPSQTSTGRPTVAPSNVPTGDTPTNVPMTTSAPTDSIDPAAASGDSDSGGSGTPLIVIVVVVCALIVAVGLGVLWRRRGHQAQATSGRKDPVLNPAFNVPANQSPAGWGVAAPSRMAMTLPPTLPEEENAYLVPVVGEGDYLVPTAVPISTAVALDDQMYVAAPKGGEGGGAGVYAEMGTGYTSPNTNDSATTSPLYAAPKTISNGGGEAAGFLESTDFAESAEDC